MSTESDGAQPNAHDAEAGSGASALAAPGVVRASRAAAVWSAIVIGGVLVVLGLTQGLGLFAVGEHVAGAAVLVICAALGGWLAGELLAQGSTVLTAEGITIRRRILGPRRFVPWSEIRAWQVVAGNTWIDTDGDPIELMAAFWPSRSMAVERLRTYAPAAEGGTVAVARDGVITARSAAIRRDVLFASGIVLGCITLFGRLVLSENRGTFDPRLLAILLMFALGAALQLVRAIPHSKLRVDSQFVRAPKLFARRPIRWDEVVAWSEDQRGFVIDTRDESVRIEARYLRSRAELRYVLGRHVGSAREPGPIS